MLGCYKRFLNQYLSFTCGTPKTQKYLGPAIVNATRLGWVGHVSLSVLHQTIGLVNNELERMWKEAVMGLI
jgi:hypothetical protein